VPVAGHRIGYLGSGHDRIRLAQRPARASAVAETHRRHDERAALPRRAAELTESAVDVGRARYDRLDDAAAGWDRDRLAIVLTLRRITAGARLVVNRSDDARDEGTEIEVLQDQIALVAIAVEIAALLGLERQEAHMTARHAIREPRIVGLEAARCCGLGRIERGAAL